MRRRLGLLGVGVGLAAAAGCGGGPPTPYPDDVVENFVVACRTRAPESVCRCAIDRIQRAFTLEQFRAFEARLAQGDTPKELVDSVADCQGG